MGGLLTLIGTSTNLLVNDMARNAGQPVFRMFEITPVGLSIAAVGGLWLYFVGARQLGRTAAVDEARMAGPDPLKAATEAGKRHKVIVTDGVFSMDGTIAQLDKICDLADKYGALVMIDECHASGFMGKTGRGTHEHHNVLGRIDIITGTLGKALGGAMGGFTSARKEVVDMLRQKSRPYLFSNTLAPSIAGASLSVLERIGKSTELRDRLHENTAYFRKEIERIGFTIKPGTHPVVPVMLFEAPIAQKFAARMYELGVLLSGFFYPVVPMGQARVRVQLSAAHTREQLDTVLKAFEQAGRELGILKN